MEQELIVRVTTTPLISTYRIIFNFEKKQNLTSVITN